MKVLIISPHYPPSNLAGVHRSRLFAQHLPSLGWMPIILTVKEEFYEEKIDRDLELLLPEDQYVIKVNACRITKPRVIGDIGLRAFFQLRKRALHLVRTEKIDFVLIPIPSFYVSLIGRYLKRKTGVKYGIDYIDPWVHFFPGSDTIFSRHWFSTQLAKILEPIAIKNVSLITGVAEGYYKGVQVRNPKLIKTCRFGFMPYGGDEHDHIIAKSLNKNQYLFERNTKFQIVFAGTIMPKTFPVIDAIFDSISKYPDVYENVEMHFIGTGKSPNNPEGFAVKDLAEKYKLWGNIVFEYPMRIPYLDVLTHLAASSAIMIIGSTEPHYTPSKVYQAALSKKYILAVLHEKSSAVEVIESSRAGQVLTFTGENDLETVRNNFTEFFKFWHGEAVYFDCNLVHKEKLEKYSAFETTKRLVDLMNACLTSKNDKSALSIH